MKKYDLIVVGGGLSGLLAARIAATHGKNVLLLESSAQCGGAITQLSIAGLHIDGGAESFATTRPETRALLEELGIASLIVEPHRSDARIYANESLHVIPHGMMGIPSNLDDPQTVSIVGMHVVNEAKLLDSLPWNISEERSLGAIVEKRLGPEIVKKIVNPIVAGVHASDSYLLEMDSLLPGLQSKAAELNSLHLAVREMRGRQNRPGSAIAGIEGGINQLTRSLTTQLIDLGVEILIHREVKSVSRELNWIVNTAEAEYQSDYLVVATPPNVAAHLLSSFKDLESALKEIRTVDVALVSLLVKAEELASHPLGSGVLIPEGNHKIGAKASTHVSAKWLWAKKMAGEADLIRLSYGRNGIVDPIDSHLIEQAHKDMFTLYGLKNPEIIDSVVTRWPNSLVQARVGHQENLKRLRGSLNQYPGLTIVGSGVSGNGIAGVIGRTQEYVKELLNV
jgi:oxygen-dependent protoporphyrinogen oxidase